MYNRFESRLNICLNDVSKELFDIYTDMIIDWLDDMNMEDRITFDHEINVKGEGVGQRFWDLMREINILRVEDAYRILWGDAEEAAAALIEENNYKKGESDEE